MKQNQQSIKTRRLLKNTGNNGGKSKYAQKVARGDQMYGPGCCAHRVQVRTHYQPDEG